MARQSPPMGAPAPLARGLSRGPHTACQRPGAASVPPCSHAAAATACRMGRRSWQIW